MAFTLPPLPYDYTALEPHIDEQTMRIHHDKHHAAYVNNLNAALEPHADLQKKPVEELSRNLDAVPEAIRTPVRNNGGGHVNHTMFWEMMAPGGAKEPTGRARGRDQQGVRRPRASSRSSSQKACVGRFGSGWGWLVPTGAAARHREHPQPGQAAHGAARRRFWAATSGSTPTTSSTRTAGPITSPPGGTWSTGPTSRAFDSVRPR